MLMLAKTVKVKNFFTLKSLTSKVPEVSEEGELSSPLQYVLHSSEKKNKNQLRKGEINEKII